MAGKVSFSKLYREGVKSGGIKVKYEIQTQDRINFLCDAVFLLKSQEASTVRLRPLGFIASAEYHTLGVWFQRQFWCVDSGTKQGGDCEVYQSAITR